METGTEHVGVQRDVDARTTLDVVLGVEGKRTVGLFDPFDMVLAERVGVDCKRAMWRESEMGRKRGRSVDPAP